MKREKIYQWKNKKYSNPSLKKCRTPPRRGTRPTKKKLFPSGESWGPHVGTKKKNKEKNAS